MKRFLLLLTVICALIVPAKAQWVSITTSSFKTFLQQQYPGSFNGLGQLDTTSAAIVNETSLTPPAGESTWDGFQYFKNLQSVYFKRPISLPALRNGLTHLTVDSSALTALPALPASLTYLFSMSNYMLQSLPALPGSLDTLIISKAFPLAPVNPLTSLPALPASLRYLRIYKTQITALPVLPTGLRTLRVEDNPITALPTLPDSLRALLYNSGVQVGIQISSVPTLPSKLEQLDIAFCAITSLPALPSTLKTLAISYTHITSVPTLPMGLETLRIYENDVTELPALPASIIDMYVDYNELTTLPDPLPPHLHFLTCSYNHITSLPAFPSTIKQMDIDHNELTSLPPLPDSLTMLNCSANHLTSLPAFPLVGGYGVYGTMIQAMWNDFTCVPRLPNYNYFYLAIDDKVVCLPNKPATSTVDVYPVYNDIVQSIHYGFGEPFPLCNTLNNPGHCQCYPITDGHVYNDLNNNLVRDTFEPYRQNIKIQLSNSDYTYSNTNGYYQIAMSDTGNFTTTIIPPVFYTSVPMQYNNHFGDYDTLVTNDFALHPTVIFDSVNVFINEVNSPVPGFPFAYDVCYDNPGTTSFPADIIFNFDTTRLTLDSISNPALINNGNSVTLHDPFLAAGEHGCFTLYFTVHTSALVHDSLMAYAQVSTDAIAAFDTSYLDITNSADPNDKTATPTLSPSQLVRGDYIYYKIRFQNTGSNVAHNVVITDAMDSKLQYSTLQILNSSHLCKASVKSNKIYFEFLDIMLPDSNANEIKSHGYVTFRIKPKTNLALNTTIPNKANIYFDYNSPIVTNTAVTTITEPVVVPLSLLSFAVSKGVGLNANLYWQTAYEMNVKNYDIEMSTNGRTYNKIGSENAKGNQSNSYTRSVAITADAVLYFRLKMIDFDGRYAYSNIAILKNDKANNGFSLLGNPVKNELIISLQDESLRNTSASIINLQGATVKSFLFKNDIENINVASLPAGTYYLVTQKGGRQFIIVR